MDGRLVGWADFERWGVMNDPMARMACQMAGRGQISHADSFKYLAYLKTVQHHETVEAFMQAKANRITRDDDVEGTSAQ
jgi:hypothetical protein